MALRVVTEEVVSHASQQLEELKEAQLGVPLEACLFINYCHLALSVQLAGGCLVNFKNFDQDFVDSALVRQCLVFFVKEGLVSFLKYCSVRFEESVVLDCPQFLGAELFVGIDTDHIEHVVFEDAFDCRARLLVVLSVEVFHETHTD